MRDRAVRLPRTLRAGRTLLCRRCKCEDEERGADARYPYPSDGGEALSDNDYGQEGGDRGFSEGERCRGAWSDACETVPEEQIAQEHRDQCHVEP